jgi:hypothetical protein
MYSFGLWFHLLSLGVMPNSTYDIFSGQLNNAAIWLESVEGLGNAYQRMTELAAMSPGCYFIFCTHTHTVRGSINTLTPEERRLNF